MLKLISALLSSQLVMESAVAVDEQNPAGDQLVKRGDAIQSIKGSDKIFTGEVKIVPLSESVPGMPVSSAYVIFEPGARSFWHTHPIGQVLIIVEGEGRSGVYGKPVSVLKKGDVVVCPKGIKHFHGAAPDKRMVQMTVTGYDPQGKNVTWMEPVTDQQYKNSEK